MKILCICVKTVECQGRRAILLPQHIPPYLTLLFPWSVTILSECCVLFCSSLKRDEESLGPSEALTEQTVVLRQLPCVLSFGCN